MMYHYIDAKLVALICKILLCMITLQSKRDPTVHSGYVDCDALHGE